MYHARAITACLPDYTNRNLTRIFPSQPAQDIRSTFQFSFTYHFSLSTTMPCECLSLDATLCQNGWSGYCGACWRHQWSRISLLVGGVLVLLMIILGTAAPREATESCDCYGGDVCCIESEGRLCSECFCSNTATSDPDDWFCSAYDDGSQIKGGLRYLQIFFVVSFFAILITLCFSFCVDHGAVGWGECCEAGCCTKDFTCPNTGAVPGTSDTLKKEASRPKNVTSSKQEGFQSSTTKQVGSITERQDIMVDDFVMEKGVVK